MQPKMQKQKIMITGEELIPEKLVQSIRKLCEITTDAEIMINLSELHPKKGKEHIFGTFIAPNIIQINTSKCLMAMDTLRDGPMSGDAVAWCEVLRTAGHELYHMTEEYMKESSTHDCKAAEEWGKQKFWELVFSYDCEIEHDDSPFSREVQDWTHCLTKISEEKGIKRQMFMAENDLIWYDNDEYPAITFSSFADLAATQIENAGTPIWKIQLETKKTPISEEISDKEEIKEPAVSIETEPVYEEDTIGNIGKKGSIHDVPNEEPIYADEYRKGTPTKVHNLNPTVEFPTMQEMRVSMYYIFMSCWQKMFENCGWKKSPDGYTFINPAKILDEFSLKGIPSVEKVLSKYYVAEVGWQDFMPNKTISGLVFNGQHFKGKLPAIKLEIISTKGNKFVYTIIAQNPKKKAGGWAGESNAGAKSAVVYRKSTNKNTPDEIVARIIDGEFIADPFGKNEVITAATL